MCFDELKINLNNFCFSKLITNAVSAHSTMAAWPKSKKTQTNYHKIMSSMKIATTNAGVTSCAKIPCGCVYEGVLVFRKPQSRGSNENSLADFQAERRVCEENSWPCNYSYQLAGHCFKSF